MPFNRTDVKKLYTKYDKLKEKDVAVLLEWTKTQPHLPDVSEMQAILFLHSCHYQIEAAKKTLDNYFTCRTRYPLYFIHASEDVIRRFVAVNFVRVLPRRTPEDDIIVEMKFLQTSTKVFHSLEHIQVSTMVLTLYIHQCGPSEGLIFLLDMDDVSFGHLFKINFLAVKRMMWFLQEAAPVRIKSLHFVNTVPVTGKLLALLKPFMRKEVADAIKVHSTLETLYDYVPKKCLPADYGGELPPVKTLHEDSAEQLLDNLEFFEWHDSQRVDESKRPK